jgi:Fe-S-cluster containining protein
MIYPGNPCKFKGDTGCTIYEDRPIHPCRNYQCYWLEDPEFVPEEFWPMKSNTIMTRRSTGSGIPYLEIKEAGDTLSVEILDWAIQNVQLGLIKNFVYTLNGKQRFITSNQKFAEELMGVKPQETSSEAG